MNLGESGERVLPPGGTRSSAARKPSVHTWQRVDPPRLESVRLLVAETRLLASGRLIAAADADVEAFSASFEASVDKGETAGRLLLRTTTAEEERQISLSRTEDGAWLVDRAGASRRDEFDGSLTVAVGGAVTFHTLPIRRLGLHRAPSEVVLPVVWVRVPDLAVSLVSQTYRTVSIDDSGAVIAFTQDGVTTELVVDTDGVVVDFPGVATRV
ncbi:putative glycolipid-binding domain-containing protein [Actinokineospora sp. HUAS TT18]|uniref:putative glycolipid-binding domain-containing protein n=1 Tax=Actinokineospora sp. HUAS TT18 TaxID=3447451 RepID=UPI003F5204C8